MSRFQTLTPASLSREVFIEVFADIYKHSPWVVEKAYDLGIDGSLNNIEDLRQCMANILLSTSRKAQLALINAHPDLANETAIRGELTVSSISEQAGTGVHGCDAEEFTHFVEFNDTYEARFGFPFIKTAKGSSRHQILAAFEERIQHSADEELTTALTEINKVALSHLQQF